MSVRLRRLLLVLGWGSWRRRRLLQAWRANTAVSPDGRIRNFQGELFALRRAVLDPGQVYTGGEGRLRLSPGALQVEARKPAHERSSDGWLETAWDSIVSHEALDSGALVPGLTALVPRVEWANVWHAMVDVYNVYLASRFLGYEAKTTRVVFADNAQENPFRVVWNRISRESVGWRDLECQLCEELAVCASNYFSPMNSSLGPAPPYFEDFCQALRCPDAPDENLVLVVSRAGAVQRNIENEDEVAEEIRRALPEARVVLQRMELLDFQAQVELVSRASLLVGAHGAGLTHALFLPRHGALLELFPGYLQAFRFHFRNICRWRSLPYAGWINWRLSAPSEGQSVEVPAAKIAAQAARLWRRRRSAL